ncbi:type 1 glutamine amidotransferase domain-containing protein [Erythrobacter donghaensis]|uniref:type 1 glutamine amidotransferase domain-containing protein n=1 Tax=Erythrobacter donghaensis TaxID=267135 RepID=UPI000A3B2EFD|nr:type 1 glutamine amidotransferase domain-containing protein [Erythrobacter donghaensis]
MVRWITLFCALLLGAFQAHAATPTDRVLLVVSSHGRDDGKTQPGFEMDELSQAWLVLRANGFRVDIASPAGGAVVADEHDPAKPYNAAFAADAEALRKLAQTLPLSADMNGQYAAIMVIGGKGAMFDLPFSQLLQSLLVETEARGGVVAAVCHGPAVFARIRNADGTHWISGRRVTGFADEEEQMFGKQWVPHFPFLLESELRRLGADVSDAPIMLPHVVTDGRLVTGQNPFSVAAAADAVVAARGKTPAPRELWPDERSLALVAQAVAGDAAPLAAGLQQDGRIDVPLVAIWGYYRALQAKGDPAMLAPALKVMELARPHFPEPQLDAAIAEARAALANQQQP